MAKCTEVLDGFVFDKEESLRELAMPVLVKAKKPFLRITKRIGPTKNLEAGRQTALAIARRRP